MLRCVSNDSQNICISFANYLIYLLLWTKIRLFQVLKLINKLGLYNFERELFHRKGLGKLIRLVDFFMLTENFSINHLLWERPSLSFLSDETFNMMSMKIILLLILSFFRNLCDLITPKIRTNIKTHSEKNPR